MDIYLCSKLHFAISSANGLDAIPIIFKKPIVEIAVAPIDLIRTYSSRIKILFKTYFSKTLQRKLTLKEIYNFGLQNLQGNDLADEIEFIHPTSEEITSAALEMHEELQNDVKYSDEEKILINNFKNNAKHQRKQSMLDDTTKVFNIAKRDASDRVMEIIILDDDEIASMFSTSCHKIEYGKGPQFPTNSFVTSPMVISPP